MHDTKILFSMKNIVERHLTIKAEMCRRIPNADGDESGENFEWFITEKEKRSQRCVKPLNITISDSLVSSKHEHATERRKITKYCKPAKSELSFLL